MKLTQRITVLLFLLVGAVFSVLTVRDRFLADRTPPVLHCASGVLEISVNEPEETLLYGVTAIDDTDGDLSDQVLIQSVSPLITNDTAKVSYVVFDSANNMATASRTIRYVDYQKPTFDLLSPLVFQVGKTVTLKDRLRAYDVIDGNITDNIRVTSQNLSTQYEGAYTVTVQVTNSMGDSASVPLRVVMAAQVSPQMIYLKDYIVYLELGEAYDAADNIRSVRTAEGDYGDPAEVQVSGAVDTSTPGVYDVLYTYANGGRTYQVYLTAVVDEP